MTLLITVNEKHVCNVAFIIVIRKVIKSEVIISKFIKVFKSIVVVFKFITEYFLNKHKNNLQGTQI
jgi:hypothetical protein